MCDYPVQIVVHFTVIGSTSWGLIIGLVTGSIASVSSPDLSYRRFRRGSAKKEISYTVSRNPIWNPEIHSEIQKSNLKSRNALWNLEKFSAYIRIPYFKLITPLDLPGVHGLCVTITLGQMTFVPDRFLKVISWGDVCICIYLSACLASSPSPVQN